MTTDVGFYDSSENAKGVLRKLASLGIVMTFIVIVLGAYVRLNDAGLGCPDWPGCFGQVFAPSDASELAAAAAAYPEVEVDSGKAWKEMIHRYIASSLGLVVVLMWALSFAYRRDLPFKLVSFLLVLICFQGALGMWTVTELLKPTIVTSHLIGGMSVLATFGYLLFKLNPRAIRAPHIGLNKLATAFVAVVLVQIVLGGWTSTNYTGLHCPDFPTCQGQWLPPTNFSEAFALTSEEGVNYEGGRLSNAASVTVHLTHRIGALVVFFTALLLTITAFRKGYSIHKRYALGVMILVCFQWGLGVGTVLLHLPVFLATAHNGGAALLLLMAMRFKHLVSKQQELLR